MSTNISFFTILLLWPAMSHALTPKVRDAVHESATSKQSIAAAASGLNWFTVTKISPSTVQLQWSNTTSIKGQEYLVESSVDGQAYTTVATLPASGHRFLYLDELNQEEENKFYRISVKNGSFVQTISQPQSTTHAAQRGVSMSAEESYDGAQLQLNIFTHAADAGSLKIMDSQGMLVRQESVQLNDGYNRVLLPDLNQLQSGAYFVTLQTNNGLSTLKWER